MRVLLTTDTIGGVWTFTKDLSTELLAQGHAVALISFGRKPTASQAAWAASVSSLYPRHFLSRHSVVPLEWMQRNEFAYEGALPHILRLAERFRPDVIHTSQFCFGSLPLPTPTLITAHSDVLSWAATCGGCSPGPSPWLDRYVNLVQQGLDAAGMVVAPTRWMLDALQNGFSVDAPTDVIFNGRNLPAPRAIRPRHHHAVSAGRLWDKAKNLSMLTTLSTPIFVAGDQIHEGDRTPPTRLHLLGRLEEPDLLDLFRSSSIYIVPSLYEPFGLAPLEAAQCGCAVLANDIASLREVWGDAATYFRSAGQLSRALSHLLSSKNDLKIAQNRAQAHAQTLTATRMTNHYLQLYRTLLKKPAPAPALDQLAYVQ